MSQEAKQHFWQQNKTLRVLIWSSLGVVLAVLLLFVTLYLALWTEAGLRWTVAHVLPKVSPISIEKTRGSLAKQVDFSGIRVESLGARLQLSDLSLRWRPHELWQGHVHIEHLHLGELLWLGGQSQDEEASPPPQSLTLPFSLALDDFRLAKVAPNEHAAPWLEALQFNIQSDGEMHRLQNMQFRALCGQASSEWALFGQAPLGVSGVLSCRGHVFDHALALDVSAAGVLSQVLDLKGNIVAHEDMNLEFSAEVAPFGETLSDKILQLRALFSQVDLAKFAPNAPKTQLDLGLDTAKVDGGLAGSWFINNHDKAALPLDVAAGQFRLLGEILQLENTRFLLRSGEIFAHGELSLQQIQLNIQPEGLILGQLLDRPALQTPRAPRWAREPWSGALLLSGKIDDLKTQLQLQSGGRSISGELLLQKLFLKNQELKEKQSQFSRLAQSIIHKNQKQEDSKHLKLFPDLSAGKSPKTPLFTSVQQLKIQDLLLKDDAAEVHIQGDFSLNDTPHGALTLAMKSWNPARYFQDWAQGSLNAHAELALLAGISGGQISAFFDAELEASELNQQALHGVARGAWLGDRLADVLLRLRFGASKIDAAGAWGGKGDRLQLKIDAPKLEELGGVFQGRAFADVDLGGSAALPATRFALDVADLRLPGDIAVARATGRGQLEFAEQGLFAVDLQVQNAKIAAQHLQELSAKAEGKAKAHQLRLQARGRLAEQDFQSDMVLAGALTAATQQWRGELQKLQHDAGKMSLALLSPVSLWLSEKQVKLHPSQWRFSEGIIRLQKLNLSAGNLDTAGEFSGLALSPWLQAPLQSQLILGGRWALQGKLPKLLGQVELRRESGDLRYLPDETWARPLVLALQDARVLIQAQERSLNVQTQMQSGNLGKMDAQLQLALAANQAPWDWRPDLPLRGRVSMELANMAPLSASFAPNLPAAGKLSAGMDISGRLGRPLLSGRVLGEQLALKIPEQGVNLEDGLLRGELKGEKLAIDMLQFRSGSGFIRAQGDVDWQAGTQTELALTLDKWQAVSRPDRDIVVDGQGVFRMSAANAMRLDGQIRVVRGSVGLPPDELPSLGDDVVVIRRGQPVQTAPVAASSPFSLNLEVNLGDALFFSGLGLEARLAGALQVRAEPKAPVHLSGAIRLEDGSYRAYGQNLSIERGVLSFQGSAATPAIDLIALRKGRQVEAGVAVTGTVRAPKLRLISDPDLPDMQKLSWLILGRGNLEGGGMGDLGVLLAAGQGLLSNSDSVSLQQRLASTLGLDEVALREAALSAGNAQASEQILALGKRLNDQLLLTYEQGLGGNTQVLVLTYQMSRHLSLVSRVGTETALDILYTLRFDRTKPKAPPAKMLDAAP